jgi:hypothetical protein
MATLKDYQALVKKVNESAGENRAELAKQKAAVAEELQRKAAAKGKSDRRKLKFTMDEINNS